jgi:hypothetical protein
MSFWDYTPVGAKHGGEVNFFVGYNLGLKGILARGAEEARQAVMQDYAYTKGKLGRKRSSFSQWVPSLSN